MFGVASSSDITSSFEKASPQQNHIHINSNIAKENTRLQSIITPNFDNLSQFKKTVVIQSNVLKPTIIVSINKINEDGIRKAISDRLSYLDEVFDEEEHIEKYRSTKQILIDLFNSVRLIKTPYIGIDDNGQIEAFWYEGDDYKIISLIPINEHKIIVSCLKDSNTTITVNTSLENIKKSHGRELSMLWKEIIA
jgi:hypothetical protein